MRMEHHETERGAIGRKDGDHESETVAERASRDKSTELPVDEETKTEGDEDGGSSSEAAPTPPRQTRGSRNRAFLLEDSGNDSDRSPLTARPRRRGRPSRSVADKPSPESEKKPRGRGRGRAKEKETQSNKKEQNEVDDEDGDYVHVSVGDCVLLDSGDPDNHYVALVSSVQVSQNKERPGTFTAQWYYKPADLDDDVRALVPGGVLEGEVFLSPHKDKNAMDAVIGLCEVLSKEEYDEIQNAIKRGFREKSDKKYYFCRYKHYPSRSGKKALEPLKQEDIRGGLGPQKPKVGEQHQATLPELQTKPNKDTEDKVPWRVATKPSTCTATQVWSRHVVASQELVIRQFRELLDMIRFAVGNIVKLYRPTAKGAGNIRCIVLKYLPSDSVQVCLSTGEVKSMLRSDLCSSLSDDVAMKILYSSRFNLSYTAQECSKMLIASQRLERDAYKQEVTIFARLAEQEKKLAQQQAQAAEENSNRKRRK